MIVSLCFLLVFCVSSGLHAQQIAESEFQVNVERPRFPLGAGPSVRIDAAHHNFHTADGRYKTFAEILKQDGYRVEEGKQRFTFNSLSSTHVLVISNSLNQRNQRDWSLPTPSAFEPDEIRAVKNWVCAGGSLFLIADHMPFPGAAADLARELGVQFSNGYARPAHETPGLGDVFDYQTGLIPSFITRGMSPDETVKKIRTFGGSAFIPPVQSTPIILFGKGAESAETTKAPGISKDAKRIPVEGWCQAAVFPLGRGRVAVFGEAAMFTTQVIGPRKRPMGLNSPGAEQNQQLLLNTFHWLTRHDG